MTTEIEAARRDGERFGREIATLAAAEVRRIVLSIGPRGARAIAVEVQHRRQQGMSREAASAWTDAAAAGFNARLALAKASLAEPSEALQ